MPGLSLVLNLGDSRPDPPKPLLSSPLQACTVRFSLGAAAWAPPRLREALSGAHRHAMATSLAPDGTGAIVADGASARMPTPPTLLRYHVPPGPSLVAPLLVSISVSSQPTKDGAHLCALVGVRVALSQREQISYQGADP